MVARRLVAPIGALAVAVAGASSSHAASFACPLPKLTPIPQRTSFNVGTSQLAVALPDRATYVIPRGSRGRGMITTKGIRIKVGWLSPSGGPRGFPNGGPLVTGRRLDMPGAPLRVSMGVKSFALGDGEFYPSYLFFPTTGCWQVTASNAKARIRFAVRLVKE